MIESSRRLLADDVDVTVELRRRPSRPPDHEGESRALAELAESRLETPDAVLQHLVEAVLRLTRAGSAGISLLEPGGPSGLFRWIATAGDWAPCLDGTMPREEVPAARSSRAIRFGSSRR